MQSGFLRRGPVSSVRLTNGPISYRSAVSSRDGKQIFAVGLDPRGELVRYDGDSKQFLPLLPGVLAGNASWSADGQWMAYNAYSDHAVWRSRSDGTEPLQLTFGPGQADIPSISPDGKQVLYTNSEGAVCVIGRDGGSPPNIVDKDGGAPHWSPDGSLLVFKDRSASASRIHILDLGAGTSTALPGPAGLSNPQWVGNDRLIAGTQDFTKLMVFDVKAQRWSELVSFTAPGYLVDWADTPDSQSVVYSIGGPNPMLFRVRLADRKIETIGSLKGLHRTPVPG
jgi:hypothetical protein